MVTIRPVLFIPTHMRVKEYPQDKHYSETTRKLHIPCPYRDRTGIAIHVVIKEGCCYRSEQCMVVWCKFNTLQSDVASLLSLTW